MIEIKNKYITLTMLGAVILFSFVSLVGVDNVEDDGAWIVSDINHCMQSERTVEEINQWNWFVDKANLHPKFKARFCR